jgi:hypothetical protein
MEFYFVNDNGAGKFEEKDIAKAIESVKVINADLFRVKNGTPKLVFDIKEDDEYNSDLLKAYGVYIEDGAVRDIRTKEVRCFTENELLKLAG